MKFKKIIPAVLIALILSSCGTQSPSSSSEDASSSEIASSEVSSSQDNSSEQPSSSEEPEPSSTEEPSSEIPSSSEEEPEPSSSEEPSSEEPSTQEPSSEEPSSSEPANFIEEAYGDFDSFKQTFTSWINNTKISSIKTSVYNVMNDSISEETKEAQFCDNEVFGQTIKNNYKTNVIETNYLYGGIFDDIYYSIDNMNAYRYQLVEEDDNSIPDYMSETDALNEMNGIRNEFSLNQLTYTLELKGFVNNKNLTFNKYELKETETGYLLDIHAYIDSYSDIIYVIDIDIDENGVISNFELEKTMFADGTFDFEKFIPVGENKPTSSKHCVLEKYEIVEEGEEIYMEEPSIDFDGLFVEKVENLSINSTVFDPSDYDNVYSKSNELFKGGSVYLEESIKRATIIPSTAMDIGQLYITNLSNPDALVNDGYGGYLVKGNVGDVITITIGNSFVNNVCEVTATIVESPIEEEEEDVDNSLPSFVSPINVISEDANDTFVPSTEEGGLGVLNVTISKTGTSKMFAIETTNTGPFNLNGYNAFAMQGNADVTIIKSSSEQLFTSTQLFDGEMNYMFIELTFHGKGKEQISICDPSWDYVVQFQVNITIA